MHVSRNKRTAKNWLSAGEGRDNVEVEDQGRKICTEFARQASWREPAAPQHFTGEYQVGKENVVKFNHRNS